MKTYFARVRLRGFTLTEMAIVVSISGLILGGIWTAASKAYANHRISKAVSEVLAITSSVKNAYSSKGTFGSATVELSGPGIKYGWYPSDMLTSGTLCGSGLSPCAASPWNSEVRLFAAWTGGSWPADGNHFDLFFNGVGSAGVGIPGADCPAFMAAIVGQGSLMGLDYISSSWGGATAVTTNTSLTDNIILNCGGDVVLSFTLQ